MSRDILALSANQTPSFIPDHYLVGVSKEAVDDAFRPVTIDESNAFAEIQAVDEAIKDHCEMRLQIFLTQLASCRGQKLELTYAAARLQAGRENKRGSGSLHEAHSATLPHLLHKERTWGEGTTFELKWNSTVTLPSLVNRLDIALDENNSDGQGSFRDRALSLLKMTTHGKTSILAAFIAYMEQLKRGIEILLNKESERAPQREALGYYLEVVETYLADVREDPETVIPKLLCADQSIKNNPAKIVAVVQKRMEAEIGCLTELADLKKKFAAGRKHAKDGVICLLFESVMRRNGTIASEATLKHIRAAVINPKVTAFIEEEEGKGQTQEAIKTSLSSSLKKMGIGAKDSQTIARDSFDLIQSSKTEASKALEKYFNRSFGEMATILSESPTMSRLVADTLAKDRDITRLCRSIVTQIETIALL